MTPPARLRVTVHPSVESIEIPLQRLVKAAIAGAPPPYSDDELDGYEPTVVTVDADNRALVLTESRG